MCRQSVNLDGTLKPESYFTWGQAVDILQFDTYYQRRLSDSYWRFPRLIPLYRKATYIYAHARVGCAAAEPNPSNQLLYSCEWRCTDEDCGVHNGDVWPFPTPESKRIEVYYSLAGGAKGLGYWWFKPGYPSNGLADQDTAAARALWKEIGLLGNEIKTARPLLVTSTPVDLPLTPEHQRLGAGAGLGHRHAHPAGGERQLLQRPGRLPLHARRQRDA